MKMRELYVCNSSYQVLVALWLRHFYGKHIPADLIVSNHLNDAEQLAERIQREQVFEKVYYVESLDYARYRTPYSRKERYREELFPRRVLAQYWKPKKGYSIVYLANPDRFSQLLFNALARDNRNVKAILFEDGMLTYSKLFISDMNSSRIELKGLAKKALYRYGFRRKAICDHVQRLLLFHPEDLQWKPGCRIEEIEKISTEDATFKDLCNRVFQYNKNEDIYDRKYIFMEESFSAEGMPVNDIQLLNDVAKRVGKENIMVKIHPRNPVNRFELQGYKTNKNTSIPWELIVMNIEDISDKVLITISSSSVLNPIKIFGKRVKVYSLYNLIDKEVSKSRLLNGDFWDTVRKTFLENSDMITICNTIEEIV